MELVIEYAKSNQTYLNNDFYSMSTLGSVTEYFLIHLLEKVTGLFVKNQKNISSGLEKIDRLSITGSEKFIHFQGNNGNIDSLVRKA